MSKKILVVCQHYWPENFRLNDIVDGFIERGCQVDVLCGQPNYPTGQFVEGYSTFKPKFEKHGEVNVYRTMEIKRGSNSNLRIFLNYMCYPIASWLRVASLKNNKYDSIFIYELSPVMMAFAGYRLSRLTGVPVTMYVLDLWPHNLYSVLDIQSPTLKKILAAVSARQYRKAQHLITVSDRARQYFERELDIPAHRITCIPQCPEKLYETPIVDHTLLDKYAGSFNIVFTGNVSPAQSFETVIDAARMIAERNIYNIRFIIVGAGMSLGWLKEQVDKYELNDMFYFEGFRPMEDIPKYTYMADALLACLKSTGVEDYSVPAKVMSYLAAGRPILLSMSGEAGLIIRKAKCGYVSGAEDPQGLFDNIMKLYYSSPEKRSEMGRNAFEYQQTYFERNKNIDRMLDVIFGEPEVYSDNRIRLSAEELSDETETEETYAATEETPAPAASVLFYDAAEGNVFEEPVAADTEGDDTHEPV